jgi:hypothetical protein
MTMFHGFLQSKAAQLTFYGAAIIVLLVFALSYVWKCAVEAPVLHGLSGHAMSALGHSRPNQSKPTLVLVRRCPNSGQTRLGWNVRFVPCVDGSELARAFFTFAALVGAAMCSAC